MVQTSASLLDRWSDCILCYYVNASSRLQIAQIKNVPGLRFERLIFPQQRLLFEAFPEALLEIRSDADAYAAPIEQIPCLQLRVNQNEKANHIGDVVSNAAEIAVTEN